MCWETDNSYKISSEGKMFPFQALGQFLHGQLQTLTISTCLDCIHSGQNGLNQPVYKITHLTYSFR